MDDTKEGTETVVNTQSSEISGEIKQSSGDNVPVSSNIETLQSKETFLMRLNSFVSRMSAYRKNPKVWKGGAILLLLLCVTAVSTRHNGEKEHEAIKMFTNVYAFVPEKISSSANIHIDLPEGVSDTDAEAGITFSPDVPGSWVPNTEDGVLVFDPDEPLKKGVYYAVNLDTVGAQMSGDFYVDEDPQILSIFPRADSETREDTEITIMFNRPMVPLTTLTNLEGVEIPVTITPETKGRFKWISTRSLQFIPDTTLIPSSRYEVHINEMTSVDGLTISPSSHVFFTRPLRYGAVSESPLTYRAPMVISFNQPVDLEETKDRIRVEKEGSRVSIDVVYGEMTIFDRATGKRITKEDQSKVFIYQKKDMHGRQRLWDFDTTYTLTVDGAVPKEGDIELVETRATSITVSNIVAGVDVTSERASYAALDIFDPEGKVIFTFYDEIDKEKSRITGKGIRDISYGERCVRDEYDEEIMLGDTCKKEADPHKLILSFNAPEFGVGESFTITLDKIYSKDGFRNNTEPIIYRAQVYPPFEILSTYPSQGTTTAALNVLYLCTNVPIRDPGDAGMSSYVHANDYIVFGRFSGSFRLSPHSEDSNPYHCKPGEFVTNINYGLLPQTSYSLELSLTDGYGQIQSKTLEFSTRAPEEQYVRFHNMQKQYNVTRPERTKFTYATENLEYVDMHICKMTPEKFLASTIEKDYTSNPIARTECTSVVEKRIELPKRYWVNNYFQVDLHDYFADTRGHYLITFSHPLLRTYNDEPMYDQTLVSVTNLAVGKKEVEYRDYSYGWGSMHTNANYLLTTALKDSQNLYWVNQSASLTPVSGAVVTQYEVNNNNYSLRIRSSGTTDGEGIARVASEKEIVGAVIRSGEDTAVVSDWADLLGYASSIYNESRTYIYTDRPIYRPGHTVYIKGIDRIGFDGAYEVWQEDNASLVVYDAMGAKIFDTLLPVNVYGTFNTEFTLPKDAPLGTYRIEAFGQSSWFDVEEYVPAPFKLETVSDKEEYTNGDTIKLDVQADYYFGVPLDGGKVSYSVTAQDYYFDRYTDEYFNFGNNWYYCYSCGYGDTYLFRGETRFDAEGHAVIEREIQFDEYFSEEESKGSKLITVSVVAQDSNGRSVSTQRSFIMHKGAFYIGVVTDTYYTGVGSGVEVRVKTVDQEGAPLALRDITKTIYKVDWETFKRQEVDGGFYYRSEKRLTEVRKSSLTTDVKGDWQGSETFSEEGEYEIHIAKNDADGNRVETITRVYIYGDDVVQVPPNNNYELDLEVEKSSVDVGDTASVLIKSPYEKAKVLITTERGLIYDYWVKDVTGGILVHEFPIISKYSPNVFLSALLLTSDPEVKYGSTQYTVGIDEHVLKVDVTANKEEYLPGEKVTLTVMTKDSNGKPIPAEVSLAVADLSVLALKGNQKKDPLQFFYSGFPLSVSTASNIKNILYEVDIPLGTKGGGGDPNDLATKKRGLFKDTAFWKASVETDAEGNASVSFDLPDNLTTWQIESIGITKDTKIGVDYTEIKTKKDLMAVPLKPRFVVPGDTFSLGAKIFNQTDAPRTIHVSLDSTTLIFKGEKEQTVHIGKDETATIYFEVESPGTMRAGEHIFTFAASDGMLSDMVEQAISITPNTTYETVATANTTRDATSTEYLFIPPEVISGEGGLTIHANATMAVFMTDALTYMATYPYGCSEQLASSLSTIGTLTRALTLPNVVGEFDSITHEGVTYKVEDVVKDGLTQIYKNQTSEGGFAYYSGLPPNLALTIHVLIALQDLKDAGFEVREQVLEMGATYVARVAQERYNQYAVYNRENVIWAEHALRRVNNNSGTPLTSIVKSLIKDDKFVNEEVSSMTLAYLAIMLSHDSSLGSESRIYNALENRIDIDGRGAYLSFTTSPVWAYYETSIKDTALLLKALALRDHEHPQIGNILRWLLAGRDTRGVWGSTHNTFVVVDAMIEYLKVSRETEAEFNLKGFLGGAVLFDHRFTAKNIFETFTHFVPIDALTRNTLVPLSFVKEEAKEKQNTLYYDMSLKYFLPVENLPLRDEGITITRELYALTDTKDEKPLAEAKVGDVIRGKIAIMTPSEYKNVAIEDFIPAGFEIVNANISTEAGVLDAIESGYSEEVGYETERTPRGFLARAIGRVTSFFGDTQSAQVWNGYSQSSRYDSDEGVRTLYPSHIESHDDRVFLFVEQLAPGIYEYEYYIRALVPGTFQYLPARAEELYFPEVFGRTSGSIFKVTLD